MPLIWAPIVAVLVLQGWQQRPGASGVGFLGLVACGLLLWQLIEYCIHRLLFHKAPKGSSIVLKYRCNFHKFHPPKILVVFCISVLGF